MSFGWKFDFDFQSSRRPPSHSPTREMKLWMKVWLWLLTDKKTPTPTPLLIKLWMKVWLWLSTGKKVPSNKWALDENLTFTFNLQEGPPSHSPTREMKLWMKVWLWLFDWQEDPHPLVNETLDESLTLTFDWQEDPTPSLIKLWMKVWL